MNQDKKREYGKMILLALDGLMDDEQFAAFDRKLREDSAFRKYYLEFMSVNSSLNAIDKFPVRRYQDDSFIDSELLNLFAEIENSSPAIEIQDIPKDKNKNEQIIVKHESVKTNRFFKVYNGLVSVAAVLLLVFILYVNVFPPKYTVTVAKVTDQIGVKWNNFSAQLNTGDDLLTNQAPYTLDEGIVKIQYLNGVDVLIEAPARFDISAEDRVSLQYGKAYAVVSNEGTGFSIYTNNAKVIDLGTEFGVYADLKGNTSVHVLKGKTMLIAENDNSTVSLEIKKGIAKKVLSDTQLIEDISCQEDLFVREISSSKKFVWRGQNFVSLADIVGGGNGFGTGKKDYGYDINTGKYHYFSNTDEMYETNNDFVMIDNKYIDGVFVPNGAVENSLITSTGITFNNFPITKGETWGGVFNGCFHMSYNVAKHKFTVNGVDYGYRAGEFAICMHSNKGVTFNLDEIRNNIDGFMLNEFSTEVLVSETSLEYLGENSTNKIDFYVIVDGQQRYLKQGIDPHSGQVKVSVPIQANDTFLTLVVSESDDSASLDWCFLKAPKINLIENN